MATLAAVIWDVDGTLAETERDGHRIAFNEALAEAGAAWEWDVATYGRLLRVTGGYERLLHDLDDRPEAPASADARARFASTVHARKNRLYAQRIEAIGLPLRPGVARLIDDCRRAGIASAIATTTSRANVDALLRHHFGGDWTHGFAAVVCAEDAPVKKPDPSAYRIALERLGIAACTALAIEDSPNGLVAATGAGIRVLITRSVYFHTAGFDGCAAICDDLDGPVAGERGRADRVDVPLLRRLVEDA